MVVGVIYREGVTVDSKSALEGSSSDDGFGLDWDLASFDVEGWSESTGFFFFFRFSGWPKQCSHSSSSEEELSPKANGFL